MLCLGLMLPFAPQQPPPPGQTVPPTQTPKPSPPAKPKASSPGATEAPTYAKSWQQALGNAGPLTLVVAESVLVVCGGSPPLVARSLKDGNELWHSDVMSLTRPTVGDKVIFVTSAGHIAALDVETGAVRWRDDVTVRPSSTLWRAGWLFLVSDERVVAYRGADGSKVWDLALPQAPTNLPVIDGDRLFLTLADRTLTAVDVNKGIFDWSVPLESDPSPLLAANGLIYFGGTDGNVYAYEQVQPQRPLWAYRGRSGVIGAPIADAAHVYVVLLDNTVRALDARVGTMRWSVGLDSRAVPGLVLGKDVLLVPLASADVLVSTPKTGKPTANVAFPKPADAPPGFFHKLEAVCATPDASRIFLVTATLLDERTLTALDRAAPAAKSPSAGRGGG